MREANYLRMAALAILMIAGTALAQAQASTPAPTPAQGIRRQFSDLNRRILEMAKDFPEDKYDFRPSKEVRSFREVIVHAMSGDVYAAKAGRGEKANWDEIDAKQFKTKAEVVAMAQKAVDDSEATLKQVPEEQFTKSLRPWLGVIEHTAEHYGQLVVYYRLNGLVPPETRKGNSQ